MYTPRPGTVSFSTASVGRREIERSATAGPVHDLAREGERTSEHRPRLRDVTVLDRRADHRGRDPLAVDITDGTVTTEKPSSHPRP
jgi:hypothetical protein